MKRKIALIIISIMIVMAVIIGFSYAFFALNLHVTNNIIYSATFQDDYSIIVSVSNDTDEINISSTDMLWSSENKAFTGENITLMVNLVNNSSIDSFHCEFDILWQWQTGSGLSNYEKSSGATKEYTITGTGPWFNLDEKQLGNYSSTPITIAHAYTQAVSPNGVQYLALSFTTKFYNLTNVDQSSHIGKSYAGRLKVGNVTCKNGDLPYLADYIINDAPKTSSQGILTSDRTGEWRYAGPNPDNYIYFNGELWRIIGVMPNMTYCTGDLFQSNECATTATGSLVKIISYQPLTTSASFWDFKGRNVGTSVYNYGSNDWSDSQLMYTLNGGYYMKTSYDINNNQLHGTYQVSGAYIKKNNINIFDISNHYLNSSSSLICLPDTVTTTTGYSCYRAYVHKLFEPSQWEVRTVKWDLYGTNSYSTAAEGSPAAFYNKERNINNTGAVFTNSSLPENRAVYWYGKVGLIYPSDYGYATGGDGTESGTYSRAGCLESPMAGWNKGSYSTYCAGNNWLDSNPKWTMTPLSSSPDSVFVIQGRLNISTTPSSNGGIHPVLYLRENTQFMRGSGTRDDPYYIFD